MPSVRLPGSSPLIDLLEKMAGERPSAAPFLRGLSIGAVVGAAIAGSALWERRRGLARRLRLPAGNAPDRTGDES